MMANIASDDALILPHRANPAGLNFRERQPSKDDCLAASVSLASAILLPSGPANTRCSVCRFDPGGLHVQRGLHVQLSPAPGTDLQSPETGSQNRRYRDLSRRQRPQIPHLNPRKCPQSAGYSSETGKHRFASNCVVVDAAWIEPVSTAKFPANRENNREFCGFWRSAAILTPNRRASSMVSN
jgi:hypothetical protein